jgi:NitT/TauT family transport system substrate-binding protein
MAAIERQTRRRILGGIALAVPAAALPLRYAAALEPPPETAAVRLPKLQSICVAPQDVVSDLLRAEGFTEVRYVPMPLGVNTPEGIAKDLIDFGLNYAPVQLAGIDRGISMTVLAGVHVGCFELFVHDSVHGLADLKGKSVGLQALGSPEHLFLSVIVANVGIDPRTEIRWVTTGKVKAKELFIDGKIDAFLGFPPEPQELRAKHIGRVILDSALDRPWSQYFCCMLGASDDYVRRHPVASKRVVRAILKAADLCASEPAAVARQLVGGAFTPNYDYAEQALREVPYDKWREYDAEDTMRFYALRLHEVGMVKTDPKRIIAAGTDWRFLDQVKRELKT